MQITIKLWYLAEVWCLLELPKIGKNSRLHLFLMFPNDRFQSEQAAETNIVIQYVPYCFVCLECKQGHFVLVLIGC